MSQQLIGLSESEALRRRAIGQGNNVEFHTSRSYWQIIQANAFTFINTVLFGIGIVLIALGRAGDAFVTAGLVLLNVIFGVVQEGRAKRALDKISLLTRPTVTLIRDGLEKTVDPAEIVMGDLVIIRPGDQIAVDGTLLDDGTLEVDESLLTGESDHVVRRKGDSVHSGSFCITGTATIEVTQVGANSYANQLTARARDFRLHMTPLQEDVNFIIRLLVLLTAILGGLLALNAVRNDVSFVESVQVSAVVVALVPQGLFFMVTVSYALAVMRMANTGALIQRANAIESMSNVNVLCLDKTGTLTSNHIKFHDLAPIGINRERLGELVGIFAASTRAANRTSEALAAAFKHDPSPIVDEIPFSSERKWSAISFDANNGSHLQGMYVLGAPEILTPLFDPTLQHQSPDGKWIERGLRVLAFAHAPNVYTLHDDVGNILTPANLTPLGYLSLSDELRPEAQATLRGFAEAGIQIKIISGDNPETVAALARQAGLKGDLKTISGVELQHVDDTRLGEILSKTTIFGRITPYQKEQLVRVLQKQGAYVAMIGDGVNDVLSLKQAEIGIAMHSGSQATRSVADIVLLNDSFSVLPRAFMEGQRIINAMLDVIRLFLARTFTLTLLIYSTAVVGLPFPLTPKHNSVIALLTVGIAPLLMVTWAKPGKPRRGVLRSVAHFVFPAAFAEALIALSVYALYYDTTGDLALSRTVLTATTVFMGLFLIIFVEPPAPHWVGGDELSGDMRPTRMAIFLMGVFGLILLLPGLRDFFELVALRPQDIGIIAIAILIWLILLRWLWVGRILDKFLGMDFSGPPR
ncbi:MAG: cation transporter E1-E2 family ATPase [Chloroflexota bacterium]|nr:MAG: cation transporter E1-E2 family ATPase [Chloroflexota bacterium]